MTKDLASWKPKFFALKRRVLRIFEPFSLSLVRKSSLIALIRSPVSQIKSLTITYFREF